MDADAKTTQPLTIVHLCVPARVGGLESVVVGLSRGLAERGHDVTLVAVVPEAAAAESVFAPLRGSAVKTVAVEVPHRAYAREIRSVSRILDSVRPDVLHTHGYRADLLHGGRARRKEIVTFSTLHGSSKMGGLSRAFEFVQGHALRRFDGVVAVSRPLIDLLANRGVRPDRIHYIRNAWLPPAAPLGRREARRALGLPEDGALVIGWVGRLYPVKGPDVFLRSLPTVLDTEHLACVVGDGPERPALEALARDLGIQDHLRWAGSVPEASRLFSAFDLLVLSSRSEGAPMVLIEAMGQGVPIVATRVGGIPELVDGDDEGWLVPPEAPDLLSDAIRTCVDDRREATVRAERAAARVRRELGTAAWIRRHEEAYGAAIAVRLGDRAGAGRSDRRGIGANGVR